MYNPERIVAGYCEIDRKRQVITRIVANLISLIQNSGRRWKEGAEICSVALPKASIFLIRAGKRRMMEKDDILVDLGKDWLPYGGASIPYDQVPVVYKYLPDIIKAADEAVPTAKIGEHCAFFEEQAPFK